MRNNFGYGGQSSDAVLRRGAGRDTTGYQLRAEQLDLVTDLGDNLEDALGRALHEHSMGSNCHLVLFGGPRPEMRSRVLLVRIAPGWVLPVGATALAHEVRQLLAAPGGFRGWQLHPLPAAPTPVTVLQDFLLPQQYNVLTRAGFGTVDEVAAVPWDSWTEQRHVGPAFLEALRIALDNHAGSAEQEAAAAAAAAVRSSSDQERIAGWRLVVAGDGHSATVHGPGQLVITALEGSTAALALPDPAAPAADPKPNWTVDLAERILRRAKPSGTVFMRALVEQGGTATKARMTELTGIAALEHATQTLRNAAVQLLNDELPGQDGGRRWRHFFQSRKATPDGPVHDYHLPGDLVPLFREALERVDH